MSPGFALGCLAWTAALGASALPSVQDAPKPPLRPGRVLVYTVSAGFEHDVVKRAKPDELSLVERALVDLGKRTGEFEAIVTRDPHAFTPEKLGEIDLVFFYTTGELPLSKDEREALLAFVRIGGAFAGSHCATDTFYQVPEYGQMLGAYFDGHPWHQEVRVKVEDRGHPATKHLGPSFTIADEIYQMRAPYDRSKLHVLLSIDTGSVDLGGEAVHRKDGDFALAWTKEHGKGRVFYTALGHRPEVWKDERFLAHLAGGFRWAMRRPEPGADGAPRKESEEKKEPEKKGAKEPPGRGSLAVPDGFAADLIAEAPEILWPSAVTCLPDGSLIVGEDRMDMPGPTDRAVDRLIRLRWEPEGGFEKTVFADGLFAVMGLAEVDGDVFVMNMPHLTRLRDGDGDGVAEERMLVLTDLGPPAPGFPGGFNDHIVSGIRLGMDGFLYVAVGDKGIPGAHGTEGRTIQLRGGGVVRVRPDGSGLEVVATGLRNVLDVAIDERGEMFTYDNTDDGLGWWTRLTHVVAGGYYGYPWDYQKHPERMLPCMAEYGGGSPCGGLVYREAAWPEEYRGSLFFCEWGKSALRRFVLEPEGATFRVKTAEDFVSGGEVKTFKPFDVCESPDGRFLYVSDWAFEGWQSPKEAGRLWRIRRADDDPRIPSVAKPLPTDINGLFRALEDPSFNHRFRAQRELALKGTGIVERLHEMLANSSDERALRHAVWALATVERMQLERAGQAGRQRNIADLRFQLVKAIGLDERPLDIDVLDSIQDPDLPTRREAAAAIALSYRNGRAGLRTYREGFEKDGKKQRIGGGTAHLAGQRAEAVASWLPSDWLPTNDPFVAFVMRAALHELPIRLSPYGARGKPEIVAAYLPAVRGVYTAEAVDKLHGVLDSKLPAPLRAEALSILGELHRQPEPWDGTWWNIQPAKTPPPPKVVEWLKTPRILSTIRSALDDSSPEIRRAALGAVRETSDPEALPPLRARFPKETEEDIRSSILDVLGALKDDGAKDLLGSIVRDPLVGPDLRRRAIDAVCAIRTEGMIDLLASIVADRSMPPDHVLPCLRALGRLREPRTGDVVAGRLADENESVRTAAVSALVEVRGKAAAADFLALLGDPSIAVRRETLKAFGRLRLASSVPHLLPLVDDETTRDEAILALATTPDIRALDAYLRGIQAEQRNKPVRDASVQALAAIREAIRGKLEALHAAGRIDETQLAAVQGLYRDPQPIVRWRVLGPFERGKEVELPKGRFDVSRLYAALEGKDIGWIEHFAEPKDGFVDLVELLAGKANVSAYAFADVVSPIDCEVDMAVGSDDAVTVWVNDERVHDFPGDRAWTVDQDRFRVRLSAAGPNRILLRVGNSAGGWSFNAKIASPSTGPLFDRKANVSGLEDFRRYALENRGDPARGFQVFRASRDESMCIRCHAVYGVGEKLGPDLSDIGARYGREEILASILEPSQRIAEGYRSTSIELQDGRILFGMVQKETAEEIDLYDTNGELQKIDTVDVARRTLLDTSVMPDGLWSTMSKEDLADLLEWLTILRG